jgi:membrane peptidoglycan carboxypeptidase
VVVTALAAGVVIQWGPELGGDALAGAAKIHARRQGLTPLVIEPLPERSVLLAADGSELATVYLENRVGVAYDELPPVVIDAVLAAEDRRFFDHDGLDAKGVARAAWVNVRGEDLQGGSTITQQYVKNLLASQADSDAARAAAVERTFERKLTEAYYADDLEHRLTKEQILEGYLNTVYFGGGAYGIGAAAGRFFSKTVDQLSASEAATLAGLIRNPTTLDPTVNPAAALARRNVVVGTMAADGTLDPAAAAAATAAPLGLTPSAVSNGCAASPAPFFCDWVRASLEDEPSLGADAEQRRARLALGGLTITTTLDPALQAAADDAVRNPLSDTDRVAAAAVVVEPGTGRVRAMAVNRTYGVDEEANQTTVGLATSAYQTGSTFKAFTLAAAFEAGLGFDTVLPGGASYRSAALDNPASGAYTNAEPYGPVNVDLRTSTRQSVNTAYVQLQERVGVSRVAELAHRVGLRSLPLDQIGEREGSLTLGARESTPLEMANAYATFAAGGVYCDPIGVVAITHSDGTAVEVSPRCTQAVSAAVAASVTSVLADVVEDGTGTKARVARHPIAGKTGTTQDYGAAWFVGYTPRLSTAVWVGDPRGPAYRLVDVAGVSRVYGGTIPASVFSRLMTAALDGTEPLALPDADESFLGESRPVVPDVAGLPASLARARLNAVGMTVTTPVGMGDNDIVTGTEPSAGTTAPLGPDARAVTLRGTP